MVEREKTIDGHVVEVQPWGFLTLMPIKRKLLSIIAKVSPDAVGLLENLDATEDGGVDIESAIKTIASIVEAFDEKTLTWFIKTMLKQVRFDDNDMSEDSNVDTLFTGQSLLFYKVVFHVIEVNFGDFFGMLKTHSESSAN